MEDNRAIYIKQIVYACEDTIIMYSNIHGKQDQICRKAESCVIRIRVMSQY